jgi:hypothetical protein
MLPYAAARYLLPFLAFGQAGGGPLISFDFAEQQVREVLYAFSAYVLLL